MKKKVLFICVHNSARSGCNDDGSKSRKHISLSSPELA